MAVYLSASFVIIELVNNVYETLKLPEWTPAFILILLGVGFPLALIFSWIFDITPEGIEKTPPVSTIEKGISTGTHDIGKHGRLWGKVINWSLLGLFILVIAGYIIIKRSDRSELVSVHKFTLTLPVGTHIVEDVLGSGCSVAISPDGTELVYAVSVDGTSYLYLRKMNEFEAEVIAGTENAISPFFSSDGKYIGFFTEDELKKVAVDGGVPQVICETVGFGGAWGPDNTIIFTDYKKCCLMTVSSDGGIPKQLSNALNFTNEETEYWHLWPEFLPGGDVIIHSVATGENQRIVSRSLQTGEVKTIIEPGRHAIYSPDGYLIYSWQGNLFAVRFDPDKLERLGEPFLLYQNVQMQASGHYSLSDESTLIYVPGELHKTSTTLVQVDHQGNTTSYGFSVGQSPRYSPDGRQIVMDGCRGESEIWIYGLERGTFRRLTEEGYLTYWAIWTPDGKYIVYNSNRNGTPAVSLFRKRSDGTGPEELVFANEYIQQPKCWTADGRNLIYTEGINPETGMDIYMLEIDEDSIPVPLLNTRYYETEPMLSPDGKWLAYVSDESGREEVFVRSFPELEEKTQISIDGGLEPLWSPDGNTIYYRDVTGVQLMSVDFKASSEIEIGLPQLIFSGSFMGSSGPWGRNYDISPDGQYFVMIAVEETASEATQINVILNCFEELNLDEQ